jgi:hypothetical protein
MLWLGASLLSPLGSLRTGLRACFLGRLRCFRNFFERGLQTWSYRLKTTNLEEGFFRNLRRFLGRFPGFLSPEHCDRALGPYLLGAEMN